MAVQAQYPSNILLLNRNVGQESNEYSLQPPDGGLFHDQSSSVILNNVGASTNNDNPRKRGRDSSISTTPQAINNINQPLNVVSTGLGLSFGEHQQLQYQDSHYSLLATHKQHTHEVQQFLQSQGEELRRTLAEKRQRHYRALVSAAEECIARRVRDKEREVERVTRRNAELEARAAQVSAEAELWQARARAHEATAASLKARLREAQDSGGGLSCAGDAESGCAAAEAEAGPSCGACGRRGACVVVMPCRHLSVCETCDPLIQTCPACLTFKNSSLQVFLS